MLKFSGGSTHDVSDLADVVLSDARVEGVTLLGGEPFAQAESAAALFGRVRQGGKSTMVFSGYTLAELRAQASPAVDALIAASDLLVDGRYERELPEARRRWIGSSNQVMHFLTSRYSPEEPQFTAPNTAEIRFKAGSLLVNGWPDLGRLLRVKAS
jgi:anaerobic ribonucleoside-triphosphate reductase activating protein